MEDLVKQIVEKVGISEEQAKKTIEIFVEQIKGKLPAGLSDKVEDMINGKFDLNSLMGGGGFSSALGSLKNMFGGK